MSLGPASIRAARSQGLLIIDRDGGHYGEDSEYPLDGLRAACPCAECRGVRKIWAELARLGCWRSR